jgi:hypothetical protein
LQVEFVAYNRAFYLNGGALKNGAYHHKENTGYGKDYYQGTYFAGALLETVSQQSALFSVDYQAVCRKCESETTLIEQLPQHIQ